MSELIKNLKANQAKALFFFLCQELDENLFNKLIQSEREYIINSLENIDKSNAIAFLFAYLKESSQSIYSLEHAQKENLFIPRLLVKMHNIQMQDQITDHYQYSENFFQFLKGNLNSRDNLSETIEALSYCSALFDDDSSVSEYVVKELLATKNEYKMETLLALLDNENSHLSYYNGLKSCLKAKHERAIINYYIKHYNETMANVQEFFAHPILLEHFKNKDNQIDLFIHLVREKKLSGEYKLSINQILAKYTNNLEFLNQFIINNLPQIIEKDKSALMYIANIHLDNLLMQERGVQRKAIVQIAVQKAYDFYESIYSLEAEIFNRVKDDLVKLVKQQIKPSLSASERANIEKILLNLETLRSTTPDSSILIKKV